MPHKVNPIDFENAEGNLGVANALFQHLSKANSPSRAGNVTSPTPPFCATWASVLPTRDRVAGTAKGIGKLEINTAGWPTNSITVGSAGRSRQTVMRRYHCPDAYEQLKALTRGRVIDQERLQTFIRGLEIPANDKAALLALTPAGYTGNAAGDVPFRPTVRTSRVTHDPQYRSQR